MRIAILMPMALLLVVSGAPHLGATNVWRIKFKNFRIQSDGITLTGTENENGVSSLTISAFKHRIKLSHAQIKQLNGYSANGLELSFMTTYNSSGGECFNILLHSNSTPPTGATFIISVNNNGIFRFERNSDALATPIRHFQRPNPQLNRTPPVVSSALSLIPASSAPLSALAQAGPVSHIR